MQRKPFFPILTALLLSASLAGAAEWKQPGAKGRCPEGHPLTGDAGIGHLVCHGGSCVVNQRVGGGGYTHRFSTEPIVSEIAEDGPAAGRLEEGDVLTAVDGHLITTPEGGRRLANLRPGETVTLRVRRDGAETDVEIVPVTGCNMPGLTVKGGGTRSAQAQRADPPIDFGMKLECGNCGWFNLAGKRVWRSSSFPKVVEVEPEGPAAQAGIRPGDVLLRIEDYGFTEKAAGDLLGQLRPGQAVRLQIGRTGSMRSVIITPRAAGGFRLL
ncbi:MAG TPA: PDZ domain-containing protein [Thermoanaerobaculia bacterium]|nr:PDZ domain-containing protein [Thermoanaerobaculia bacterium]